MDDIPALIERLESFADVLNGDLQRREAASALRVLMARLEAACVPQGDVADALRELLNAYSAIFRPGNPWGDKARKALGIEVPTAEGHDPTNPFAPRERPQKSIRLVTDAERRAAGLDPNGGFDGPTGAD